MLEPIFGSEFAAPDAWWQGPARLVLAVAVGALAGFEREIRGRAAGLRTHMMIALGSAGFALIAMEMLAWLQGQGVTSAGEPARIIAAIVGGIGFLGAGAIIQAGPKIRGLTTAAGMWVIASAGAAVGVGLIWLGVVIGALALLVLAGTGFEEAAREVADNHGVTPDEQDAE
ncbi:MAG: MgtC/SapB family protein [Phycisphaerales bacterium JB039]